MMEGFRHVIKSPLYPQTGTYLSQYQNYKMRPRDQLK